LIQIAVSPNYPPLITASRCISQYLPSVLPHIPPELFFPIPVSLPFLFVPILPSPHVPYALSPLSQVSTSSFLHPLPAVMELPQFGFLPNFHLLAIPHPIWRQPTPYLYYSHHLIHLLIKVLLLLLNLDCSYLYNIYIYIYQLISLVIFSGF